MRITVFTNVYTLLLSSVYQVAVVFLRLSDVWRTADVRCNCCRHMFMFMLWVELNTQTEYFYKISIVFTPFRTQVCIKISIKGEENKVGKLCYVYSVQRHAFHSIQTNVEDEKGEDHLKNTHEIWHHALTALTHRKLK